MEVVVKDHGVFLGYSKGAMTIKKGGAVQRIPLHIVDRVWILTGGVAISSRLVRALSRSLIDVVFFDGRGNPTARIFTVEANGVASHRRAQYEAYLNGRGFELARLLVWGKLMNQSAALRRLGTWRREAYRRLSETAGAVAEVAKRDKDTRNKLIRAYASLVRLDGIGLVKVLEELGAVQPEADRELLAKGIEIFLSGFSGVTPETLEVEQFLNAANEVFYRFPLRLPQKLVLSIRMTSTLGGTCLQIDPEFKFFEKLVELIEEEGLELPAMVDEIKDTFSSALRKFRLSLLEKPIVTKKEKVDKIPIVFVIVALIIYLVLKQPVPSILVAILGLALKR
jgi:predicted DNA-binding ribbon-helix-helix protein